MSYNDFLHQPSKILHWKWLCIISILPLFSLNISPAPFFSGHWLFEDTKPLILEDIPAITSAGMPLVLVLSDISLEVTTQTAIKTMYLL